MTGTDEVFEALLAEWRRSESRIIGEWGGNCGNFEKEEADADREMETWRERFALAKRFEYRDGMDGGGSVGIGPDGVRRSETILSTRYRRAIGPWEVVRERTVI